MSNRWRGNRTWQVRLLIWRYGYEGAERIISERVARAISDLSAATERTGVAARENALALERLSEQLHRGTE